MFAFAVIAAVSAVASAVIGVAATAAQNKAAKNQRRAQSLRAARERVQAVREARIKEALVQQTAEGQGVATSSAPKGGVGAIQSQLGTNINFIDQQEKIAKRTSQYLAKAATLQSIGSVVSAVGSAAGTYYDLKGGGTAPVKGGGTAPGTV